MQTVGQTHPPIEAHQFQALQGGDLRYFKDANDKNNGSGYEKRRRFNKTQAHGYQLNREPGATQVCSGLENAGCASQVGYAEAAPPPGCGRI
jgi:hypothetical protein